jgi:hypothetical protein
VGLNTTAYLRALYSFDKEKTMKTIRTTLTALVAALVLAACGGGGGGDAGGAVGGGGGSGVGGGSAIAPEAPVSLSLAYAPKSYAFSWSASAQATHYELAEDPDGAGPQPETAIGGNIATASYSHSVFLPQRLNSQYRVRACNAGGCSAYTPAITPDLKQAIGYFKASNTEANDSFGVLALSADGNTLAVGAGGEGGSATGIGGNQVDNSASFSGAVYLY